MKVDSRHESALKEEIAGLRATVQQLSSRLQTLEGHEGSNGSDKISSSNPACIIDRRGERTRIVVDPLLCRRAFRVLVKLDKIEPARMRPGLSARVIIRREERPNAMLISRAAIAGRKDLKLGPCNAQECVVLP